MRDATIETVSEIAPHPNADKLEICTVLGFKTVTKIDEFKVGEKVIYVRPDSVFPPSEWSMPYRVYAEKRVKSQKIRDFWSDGCIIPIQALPHELHSKIIVLPLGEDVSDLLDIYHFELPAPTEEGALGYLPHGVGETDEKPYQEFDQRRPLPMGSLCDVDLKIDGKSTSYYYNIATKEFMVFSHRLHFDENSENIYTLMMKKYDIKNKLIKYCEENKVSLVIRGESYGVGVQSSSNNPHSRKEKGWAMFSVYNIDDRRYYFKSDDLYFRNVAKAMDLPVVDLLEENVVLTPELIHKYAEEMKSLNGKPFEGVVIKHTTGSFKVLNKTYDSKK